MQLGDDGDRSNVEDRRGAAGGWGGGRARLGVGGTLVLLVLSLVFKQDLFALLGDGGGRPAPVGAAAPAGPPSGPRARAEAELERVAVASFNDAQRGWAERLQRSASGWKDARLVLFWDQTRSGCGEAGAEMGPFYCPADERVYLDLGFYRELGTRFGAPGAFAQAYVIAHELGHHVQHLLGIEAKVRQAQQRRPRERNALSVRLELQADCLAGVWGHSARRRGLLEPGDLESGLGAAAAIGDDRLQRQAGRAVAPESFTHGSSAERVRWFRRGFEGGDPKACDTFAAAP